MDITLRHHKMNKQEKEISKQLTHLLEQLWLQCKVWKPDIEVMVEDYAKEHNVKMDVDILSKGDFNKKEGEFVVTVRLKG